MSTKNEEPGVCERCSRLSYLEGGCVVCGHQNEADEEWSTCERCDADHPVRVLSENSDGLCPRCWAVAVLHDDMVDRLIDDRRECL